MNRGVHARWAHPSSYNAPASRSATPRVYEQQRRSAAANISSRRGWIDCQILVRFGPCAAGPLGTSSISPSFAMSSTGTSTRSSRSLRVPALTMVTGRKIDPISSWPSPSPESGSALFVSLLLLRTQHQSARRQETARPLRVRPLCCAKADALNRPCDKRLQSLQ